MRRRAGAMESWEPVVAERLARAALDTGPEIEAAFLLGESLSEQNRSREAVEALRAAGTSRDRTSSVRPRPPVKLGC